MRICANHGKLTSSRYAFRHSIAPRISPSIQQWHASKILSPPWLHLPLRPLATVSQGWPDLSDGKKRSVGATTRAADLQERGQEIPGLGGGKRDEGHRSHPPKAQRKNLEAWILLLDMFVPRRSLDSSATRKAHWPNLEHTCSELLAVLHTASAKANIGTDLLASFALSEGRSQAAYELVDILLQNVASKLTSSPDKNDLSNLSWPATSLDDLCSAPIYAELRGDLSKETIIHWEKPPLDPRYSEIMSKSQDRTMTQIWKSLGHVIIQAADLDEEKAEIAMRFVYRVIAQIHKLGLVPENVYSYVPSNYTSSNPRPPILHLLSSRILSTLSDAVWRAHQDDVIEKAAKSGVSYKDLGHDPPGGRFRLKVRPLGPEVWLEFVLWCCVDGGFAMAGTQIIEFLQRRTEKPWFAVNWMIPNSDMSPASIAQDPRIDWGRVKLRHGGTVGQIEGYSSEQPFAVMDRQTVSAEVVLALVDSLANSINLGLANRGSSMVKVQDSIKKLVSFLEPHRLPSGYFDYLAVRLFQTGSFDSDRNPEHIVRWTEALLYMGSLESAKPATGVSVSLDLEPILTHSELLNGLFHQSLDAFVVLGDIRRALEAFAQIQQLVDTSKLRSISAFLGTQPHRTQGFFSSRIATIDDDFVLSHGQLPLYKLAALLDLITDSKLVRLGNWLLYSDDVDGPLIPESSYHEHCLSPALIRFAGVSQDASLLERVGKGRDQSLFFSTTLLRALANTNVAFSRFDSAATWLHLLTKPKVGGGNSGNLASLIGGILALEAQKVGLRSSEVAAQTYHARTLLNQFLEGLYNGNTGDFRGTQRSLVNRQIASILRITNCIPDTVLSELANSWRPHYPSSNEVSMYTSDFNILMAAIVETKGAATGRMIWDLFCEDPRERFSRSCAHSINDLFVPGLTENEDDKWGETQYLFERQDRRTNFKNSRHIPVTEVDDPPKDLSHAAEFEATDNSPDNSNNVEEKRDEDFHDKKEEVEEAKWAPPQQAPGISFEINHDFADSTNPLVIPKSATSKLGQPSAADNTVDNPINPVVVPNLRTLRLIVRGAINERRHRERNGEKTTEQQKVLEWSKQFFRAFGLRENAITQEVQQQPIDGEEAADATKRSLAEEKRMYVESRKRLQLRELRPVDAGRPFQSSRTITKVPQSDDARKMPVRRSEDKAEQPRK